MARFSRLEVLNRIIEVGVVPVFYCGDPEVASQILAAEIRQWIQEASGNSCQLSS